MAFFTELTNDEVYYYTYALHLQCNYFDHPPGVAVLIRLSTLNLLFTNELFIRAGAIVCAVIGTWLSYTIGIKIRNERTGFYAAVLYNTSIYSSLIAGVFILPDSPQIICWLASLLVLINIITEFENNKKPRPVHWLLFGVFSGICILCKVHGIFLWIGLGLYILFYKRQMLSISWLYISFIITMLLVTPIIFWNMHNNFVTYTYHSNRVAVHSLQLNTKSFLQATIGQLFYYNPINVWLIIRSVFFLRKERLFNSSIERILLFTGLPLIIIVSFISIFDTVLPHWSGPGFVTLSFTAAAYLDKKVSQDQFSFPVILKSSVILIVAVIAAGLSILFFYPGTFGSKKINNYGSGDFTLDMSGWKNFQSEYISWIKQQPDSSGIKQLKIVCNKWFPAAHIEYYIAHPTHTEVVGVGALNDLHNFAWLNHTGRDLKKGEDALCIVPSNYTIDMQIVYGNYFASIKPIHVFTEERGGKTSRFFTLFLLKNYKATDAVHTINITALLPKSDFNTLQHGIEFIHIPVQKKTVKPVLYLNRVEPFNNDDFFSNYISYVFHPPQPMPVSNPSN